MQLNNTFIHHVFFWLKNAKNIEDKAKLIDGLQNLSEAGTIQDFHIGEPADTNRDVIERTYSISWCVLFANAADQEIYQTDPIHLKFVEECSHLWSKVVVFDSVDALPF